MPKMSDYCEDSLFRDVCLPVISLLAVSSLSTYTVCRLWPWPSLFAEVQKPKDVTVDSLDSADSSDDGDESETTFSDDSSSALVPQQPQTPSNDHLDVSGEVRVTHYDDEPKGKTHRDRTREKERHEHLVSLCLRKASEELLINGRTVALAGLVVTSKSGRNVDEVICLSTGDESSNRKLRSFPRISIQDCRAEVLIRRCFVRFLYNELYKMVNNNGPSILEKRRGEAGFQLNSDCEVVLVLNELCAPDQTRLLAEKAEAIENRSRFKESTGNSMRSSSFDRKDTTKLSACLSRLAFDEKLCLWSVLGLQGSLLSHFVSPIYLKEVIIPSHKKGKALEMALRERLVDWKCATQLPQGYKLSLPDIHGFEMGRHETTDAAGRPPTYATRDRASSSKTQLQRQRSQEQTKYAANWIRDLGAREIVWYDTGAASYGKVSRICKASLFDLFAGLSFGRTFPTLPSSTFLPVYPLHYGRVKSQALPYKRAKDLILKHLRPGRGGLRRTATSHNNFHAFDPK